MCFIKTNRNLPYILCVYIYICTYTWMYTRPTSRFVNLVRSSRAPTRLSVLDVGAGVVHAAGIVERKDALFATGGLAFSSPHFTRLQKTTFIAYSPSLSYIQSPLWHDDLSELYATYDDKVKIMKKT